MSKQNRDARVRSEKEKANSQKQARMSRPSGDSAYARKLRSKATGTYVPPEKRPDPREAVITGTAWHKISPPQAYRPWWQRDASSESDARSSW